ncbi:MAG: selenocysteine synthase [Planctomycetaceae bacterium]|nr:selenocysteine synthase [Planctomycetaceae bacterium]
MTIYEQFGLEPIINACGTVTRLGGAPMDARVLKAFQEAAGNWVPLEHLQGAASRRIAEATNTEAGLVTAGCAASLTLGAAAMLAGDDLGRMERLPNCAGFPSEFVVAREHRSGYDHAVRASGARLVEVGFNEIVSNAGVRRTEAWEYAEAFGPETAGVFYVQGADMQPPLAQIVSVAHERGLPVLVDAAGALPPRANLTAISGTGADLVAFSGGKGVRGPQSTGILCGRSELIASAALQMLDMDDHWELWDPPPKLINKRTLPGLPRHGIGRSLKVSKEEIVALLTALELFVSRAYDDDLSRYRTMLETVVGALAGNAVECRIREPADADCWPVLEVVVDEATLRRSAIDVCRALRAGSPEIYVGHGELASGRLIVNPVCLNVEQAARLGERLREELS